MSRDRAKRDGFQITHEFLAGMLGVSRVGVTKSAALMQRLQLIGYRRGRMTILDLNGLEEISCGCFGAAPTTHLAHRPRTARLFATG
jgi:hypothetical protein